MNKLLFSPGYFPVIYQWKNIPKVLVNVFDKGYVDELTRQAVAGKKFINNSDDQILKKALAINVPNFWWVYAWLYGIPKWLILGTIILLLSAIFISAKEIMRSMQ